MCPHLFVSGYAKYQCFQTITIIYFHLATLLWRSNSGAQFLWQPEQRNTCSQENIHLPNLCILSWSFPEVNNSSKQIEVEVDLEMYIITNHCQLRWSIRITSRIISVCPSKDRNPLTSWHSGTKVLQLDFLNLILCSITLLLTKRGAQ